MGYYLNSLEALTLYKSEVRKPYFVDKTEMLKLLIPLVDEGNNHLCITGPRQFGKSTMAAMVGSFFGKNTDSSTVFDYLKIAKAGNYREHLNQYNVVYINFIDPANLSRTYDEFIKRIEQFLIRDLLEKFPDVDSWDGISPVEYLNLIFEDTGERFIFVFDEWDCVFQKDYTTDNDRKSFFNWLTALTKDKRYVCLSYMTGLLPIAEYPGGSTVNNFHEYTMAADDLFSEYFGFTDAEVDELYLRYKGRTKNCLVTRDDLKNLYGGYLTPPSADRMYNPGAVVEALTHNRIKSRTGI